jgi:hypothetical protein
VRSFLLVIAAFGIATPVHAATAPHESSHRARISAVADAHLNRKYNEPIQPGGKSLAQIWKKNITIRDPTISAFGSWHSDRLTDKANFVEKYLHQYPVRDENESGLGRTWRHLKRWALNKASLGYGFDQYERQMILLEVYGDEANEVRIESLSGPRKLGRLLTEKLHLNEMVLDAVTSEKTLAALVSLIGGASSANEKAKGVLYTVALGAAIAGIAPRQLARKQAWKATKEYVKTLAKKRKGKWQDRDFWDAYGFYTSLLFELKDGTTPMDAGEFWKRLRGLGY